MKDDRLAPIDPMDDERLPDDPARRPAHVPAAPTRLERKAAPKRHAVLGFLLLAAFVVVSVVGSVQKGLGLLETYGEMLPFGKPSSPARPERASEQDAAR